MPVNDMTSKLATRAAWSALLGLSLLAVFVTAVHAQDAEEVTPSVSLSAAYTGDFRRNTAGGLRTGSAYSDAIDLGVVWVTDGLVPGARMTANVSVMYLGGGDISAGYVGDLQGVNNLEAGNGWKLYESWVEFSFGERRNTLRAGVLDLNADFDTPVTQGIFTASPFGIGTEFSQTGARGPVCWPTTGLGVRVAGDFSDRLRWRVGAYDGAPGADDDGFTSTRISSVDGALFAGEIEYSSEHVHKLALGAWRYTAGFERIDSPRWPAAAKAHGNQGWYAHLDARLGSLGPIDFDGALRAGRADARFNAVDSYAGAGVTAGHLFATRPGDTLGVGVAHAHLGGRYRALRSFDGQPATAAETTYELVYRAELTPWLALLPMVQYVRDPGADAFMDDSWIAGLRFELTRDRSWQLRAGRETAPDGSYARRE